MKRYRKKSSDDIQQQASLALIEGQSQSQSTEVLQEEDNLPDNGTRPVSAVELEPKIDSEKNDAQTTAFTISSNHAENTPDDLSPEKSSDLAPNDGTKSVPFNCCSSVTVTTATISTIQQKMQQPTAEKPHKRDTKKESLEAKREKKAAKTLAIITGAFVICWLPFFIMALLMPLCDSCYISDYLASFFLWLGYFNSTLNPVIYTIFSPEFRQAFKRILCGVNHNRNRGRKFR